MKELEGPFNRATLFFMWMVFLFSLPLWHPTLLKISIVLSAAGILGSMLTGIAFWAAAREIEKKVRAQVEDDPLLALGKRWRYAPGQTAPSPPITKGDAP